MIRTAEVSDAEAIARVHVRTWQQAYRGLIPDEYLQGLSIEARADFWRDVLARSAASTPVWVAGHGGEVAGFASAGPSRDEEGAQIGELYAIYVLGEHQGSGLGAALLDAAGGWLHERYPQATLWVLEENRRTRDLYERHGWRFDGAMKREIIGGAEVVEARHRIIWADHDKGR